jgi:uncharacterized delta-60 repeat protein
MPITPWLRSLRNRFARRPAPAASAPRQRPFRPRVEGLEDRLTPSGGLPDPGFGSGGIVNLPHATDYAASAVAVQPDGRAVVVGQITRSSVQQPADAITVQRLNRDGSLDTTFNKTGSLTIQTGKSDWPTSVVLQPDGKILVGGGATANNGSAEFLVARVNANGSLDTTFGSKGLWVSASPYGVVKKLAVLTDPAHPTTVTGIVAAAQGYANGAPCFEAIKLTPAGVPDRTFGSGGFAVFAQLNGERVESVALDRLSGDVYLAGEVTVNGTDGSPTSAGCLAEVTPAGALDPGFGNGAGYVLADPTAGDVGSQFNDVTVQTVTVNGQATSRIVVAGQGWNASAAYGIVSRYTAAGLLDASFASGGIFSGYGLTGGRNAFFTSLGLAADGSIVVGGYQWYTAADGTGHSEMLVGHLTVDGAADTSFGPDGTGFTVVRDGLDSRFLGLAMDSTDGSILLCGSSSSSSATSSVQAAVVRLTAPG